MLDSETKKRSGSWVVGIAAAAAIAVVVAVYLWVHRGPPEAPPAEPVAQAPASAPDVRLPSAEDTDARIRRGTRSSAAAGAGAPHEGRPRP